MRRVMNQETEILTFALNTKTSLEERWEVSGLDANFSVSY